jgi:hypothetical protein
LIVWTEVEDEEEPPRRKTKPAASTRMQTPTSAGTRSREFTFFLSAETVRAFTRARVKKEGAVSRALQSQFRLD